MDIKINAFTLASDFDKFFYKINKSAYLLAFTKIVGAEVDISSKEIGSKVAIYISDEHNAKINETIDTVNVQLLMSELNTIVSLRNELYEHIISSNTYKNIENSLINLVAYKYIFERCVYKIDSNTLMKNIKDVIFPHKFFMSDKKYSIILKRYGFLFSEGAKQNMFEAYFRKSKELLLQQNLDSAIKLGFTISEEEDYLIALVFNLEKTL